MRILLQRVLRAEVRVHPTSPSDAVEITGRIDGGYVLLVGITHTDTTVEAQWLIEKIITLRLFADESGKMNRDLTEQGGALLVISQFTLYGDARKGRRPSFLDAAAPSHAEVLYNYIIEQLRQQGCCVATGQFGAMMEVELVNDGPVTLWLEREAP